MAKYGLFSDIHFHDWSAFSKKLSDGVNSRLFITMEAFTEAVHEMASQGVKVIFMTGDMFHVRGRITPSVFNPVARLLNTLASLYDVKFVLMAGNHDLEEDEATEYGCSFDSFRGERIFVCKYPSTLKEPGTDFIIIPWIKDRADIEAAIKEELRRSGADADNTVLLLHVPLNDTIPGLPNHGFDPSHLAKLGLAWVFSGHYHNHVVHPGNVVSVGALTHQTLSDVGSKAGYIILDTTAGTIQHYETGAPKFIKFDSSKPLSQVKNNYVFVETTKAMSEVQIEKVKDAMIAEGAEGVVVRGAKRTSTVSRTASVASPTKSLQSIVTDYSRDKYGVDPELEKVLEDIVKEAESKHD